MGLSPIQLASLSRPLARDRLALITTSLKLLGKLNGFVSQKGFQPVRSRDGANREETKLECAFGRASQAGVNLTKGSSFGIFRVQCNGIRDW